MIRSRPRMVSVLLVLVTVITYLALVFGPLRVLVALTEGLWPPDLHLLGLHYADFLIWHAALGGEGVDLLHGLMMWHEGAFILSLGLTLAWFFRPQPGSGWQGANWLGLGLTLAWILCDIVENLLVRGLARSNSFHISPETVTFLSSVTRGKFAALAGASLVLLWALYRSRMTRALSG